MRTVGFIFSLCASARAEIPFDFSGTVPTKWAGRNYEKSFDRVSGHRKVKTANVQNVPASSPAAQQQPMQAAAGNAKSLLVNQLLNDFNHERNCMKKQLSIANSPPKKYLPLLFTADANVRVSPPLDRAQFKVAMRQSFIRLVSIDGHAVLQVVDVWYHVSGTFRCQLWSVGMLPADCARSLRSAPGHIGTYSHEIDSRFVASRKPSGEFAAVGMKAGYHVLTADGQPTKWSNFAGMVEAVEEVVVPTDSDETSKFGSSVDINAKQSENKVVRIHISFPLPREQGFAKPGAFKSLRSGLFENERSGDIVFDAREFDQSSALLGLRPGVRYVLTSTGNKLVGRQSIEEIQKLPDDTSFVLRPAQDTDGKFPVERLVFEPGSAPNRWVIAEPGYRDIRKLDPKDAQNMNAANLPVGHFKLSFRIGSAQHRLRDIGQPRMLFTDVMFLSPNKKVFATSEAFKISEEERSRLIEVVTEESQKEHYFSNWLGEVSRVFGSKQPTFNCATFLQHLLSRVLPEFRMAVTWSMSSEFYIPLPVGIEMVMLWHEPGAGEPQRLGSFDIKFFPQPI